MGESLISLDVFKSGIDDSLRVIDVYKDEILKDSLPASATKAVEGIKGLKNTGEDILTSNVDDLAKSLDLGLSKVDASKILDIDLPKDIDALDVLNEFPAESLTDIQSSITALAGEMRVDEFLSLDGGSLGGLLGTALSILSSGLPCLGTMGFGNFAFNLGKLKLDILNSSDCGGNIDAGILSGLSSLPTDALNFAGGELMKTASLKGNSGLASLISNAVPNIDMGSRLNAVSNIVSNYALPSTSVASGFSNIASNVIGDLNNIAPSWLSTSRGSGTAVNSNILANASSDFTKVLSHNAPIADAVANIGDIPIVSNAYDAITEDVNTYASSAYTYLSLA